MTIIGKILTFLIFFFSLLFLGFAITINNSNKYKNGQNWPTVVKKLEGDVEKLTDDLKAKEGEIYQTRSLLSEQIQTTAAKDAANEQEKTALKEARANAETAKNETTRKFQDSQVLLKQTETELANRSSENQNLSERIKKLENSIAALNAEVVRARNKEVESRIALETTQANLLAAENKVRTLTSEIENKGADKRVSPGERMANNPPPLNVRGEVSNVSSSGAYVEFNLGSDDGLQLNHTMEVFRLNPAEYVTKIVIKEIYAKKAVGMVVNDVPGRKVTVRKGDTVSSSILPTLGSK